MLTHTLATRQHRVLLRCCAGQNNIVRYKNNVTEEQVAEEGAYAGKVLLNFYQASSLLKLNCVQAHLSLKQLVAPGAFTAADATACHGRRCGPCAAAAV